MLKKMSSLFVACASVALMSGAAEAVPYAVVFDADASASSYAAQTIYGYDLEAAQTQSVNGVTVDFVTVQSLGADGVLGNGDTFTENITLVVLNGVDANGTAINNASGYYTYNIPSVISPSNLKVDIALGGSISNYSDGGTATTASTASTILDDTYSSSFTSGSAKMYVDANNNNQYDSGETVVAEYTLAAAGDISLTGSVFAGGVGSVVSFAFTQTYANPDYYAEAAGYEEFFESIASGLFITMEQGGIVSVANAVEGVTSTDPDEILIGWRETGFDADFEAVPEPSTMLLMGAGLIGAALIGRRKSAKKDAIA
jgi:hypothetical protein